MANSNSVLSPYEILPIDQAYCVKDRYIFTELATFAFRSGAMINLHWLELPMARTIFHDPKGVRAIEVRMYDQFRKLKGKLLTQTCIKYVNE